MIDAVQPHKPDQDKVDGNDEVQQPRHNQDRDACDEGNDRRNVCGRKGHDDRGIISGDRTQDMCPSRNNPEKLVGAAALRLPEQLQFIAGCWPPDLVDWGRGVRSGPRSHGVESGLDFITRTTQ